MCNEISVLRKVRQIFQKKPNGRKTSIRKKSFRLHELIMAMPGKMQPIVEQCFSRSLEVTSTLYDFE